MVNGIKIMLAIVNTLVIFVVATVFSGIVVNLFLSGEPLIGAEYSGSNYYAPLTTTNYYIAFIVLLALFLLTAFVFNKYVLDIFLENKNGVKFAAIKVITTLALLLAIAWLFVTILMLP